MNVEIRICKNTTTDESSLKDRNLKMKHMCKVH